MAGSTLGLLGQINRWSVAVGGKLVYNAIVIGQMRGEGIHAMSEGKIGPFIAQLRKERKLTQKELAAQLHITDKAVSKWERGVSHS